MSTTANSKSHTQPTTSAEEEALRLAKENKDLGESNHWLVMEEELARRYGSSSFLERIELFPFESREQAESYIDWLGQEDDDEEEVKQILDERFGPADEDEEAPSTKKQWK